MSTGSNAAAPYQPDVPPSQSEGKDRGSAGPVALRWWPAMLLLILMVGLRFGIRQLESPPLSVMMIGFMGPAVVALLLLVWWLFASRAGIKEKLVGFASIIGMIILSVFVCDPSLQGMVTGMYVVPSAIAMFAVGLILQASKPATRLPVALVLALIALVYWGMLRSEGVTGRFDGEFAWRWEPKAEDEYVKSLANSDSSTVPTPDLPGETSITLVSAEWPSFRGPHRDGKQPGVHLNTDWQANPPKQIWSRQIGPGWSSFVVAGRRLFTQEQRGKQEAVVCLDANTGNQLWAYTYESRFEEAIAGAGPRATPTIADEGLFALGGAGILVALNPVTGEKKWQSDIAKDAHRSPPPWGFASSPLVHEGLVIVHAGGADKHGILAYDSASGELKWEAPSGDHSYSSPHLATFSGVTGVLMETNAGLQFLNPSTGEVLWDHDWKTENYRAIQPLVINQSVYLATSLGMGTRRLDVNRDGENWDVKEVWTSLDMKPDFNDFVEHKGYVYGFDSNIFGCIDVETGKRQWKKGRYGNGQVLLLPDADLLLISSETDGVVALVKADPERFTEVARFEAISGKTWNHPVLIGNRLYLRNGEQATCYELPAE